MHLRRLAIVLLVACLSATEARAREWAPPSLELLRARPMSGRTPLPRGLSLDEALASDGEWKPIEAKTPGTFSADKLSSGFARMTVPAEAVKQLVNEHGIALLDVQCASTLWIDGRPRPGDVYGYGFVTLPVKLDSEHGSTLIATPSRRGDLVVRLRPAPSDVMILDGDRTLPDFLKGEAATLPAALLAANATDEVVTVPFVIRRGDEVIDQRNVRLPARSIFKVAFWLSYDGGDTADYTAVIGEAEPIPFSCEVRAIEDERRRTFVSALDGSVQYYALREALGRDDTKKALVLSVHGASVKATNQARAYSSKRWTHLACPTNRRPFGFDWESWGRVDALEALADAKAYFADRNGGLDESRVYLTGHSMGGHGTWHLGTLYPDRFAAIGPSAGWMSFDSYGGRDPGEDRPEPPKDPNRAILYDAARVSDTRPWLANLKGRGVYILHGDADESVPVRQAEAIAERLRKLDVPYALHIEPGASHWWDNLPGPGAACVDWPPIFDLFAATRIPDKGEVRELSFVTPDLGVTDTRAWATILRQTTPLQLSRIDLRADPHLRQFVGSTENVAALRLDTAPLLGEGSVTLMLDDEQLEVTPTQGQLLVMRGEGGWRSANETELPPRPVSRFMDVMQNRPVFVYATGGEGEWAANRARAAAEDMWYRGNGTIDVVSDAEFDPADTRWAGRNVLLFGTADTHDDWATLIGERARVTAEDVTLEGEQIQGDDLVLLAAYRHPTDAGAVVGIVAPTSRASAVASDGLPLFVSGVHYPRATVLQRADGEWELVAAKR